MNFIKLLYFSPAVVSFFACSCSDSCEQNQNAIPLAGFYEIDENGILQQVTIDSLQITGVGIAGDSVLSSANEAKSQIYLPFRIDAESTQYVFADGRVNAFLKDTVTFDYTSVPRFVSMECGVSYVYHIKDISWQGVLIDSVVCPDGYIDNTNIENLRIYFRSE